MRALKTPCAAVALATLLPALLGAPASATHWTGSGALSPLFAFSGEVVAFTFKLNNSAPEPLMVFQVRMVACWHGAGGGSDIKPDDGTTINIAAGGSANITGDVNVPPLADGLCHTAIVVKGQATSDATPGYGDYHFDVNYSTRPALEVALTAAPLDAAPPLWANFTVAASGGAPPYSFAWEFGDGANGTGAQASHNYTTVGRFNATVVVSDSAGRRKSASELVWVHSGMAVNLTASPTQGDAPLTVTFNASFADWYLEARVLFTYDINIPPPDFGLGFPDNRHVYTVPGNYTAWIGLTDQAGATANATVQIRVFAPLRAQIQALSEADGLTFRFAANASGGEGALSFHWVFGDGALAVGPTARHTYAVPGTYLVYVHVTDGATGRVFAANATVVAQGPPPKVPGLEAFLVVAGVLAAAVVEAHRRRGDR